MPAAESSSAYDFCKTSRCKFPLLTKESEGTYEEKNVRLFHDDTLKSFYRRMDFSPDGELLVIPAGVLEVDAFEKTPNCTYVFSRTNFKVFKLE